MSCATGWRMRQENPRLPCSTLPIQCRYCTGSDRSSHSSARICASTCGSPRSSPGHHQRGIARHELLQAEHQNADQQQGRDDLRDARAEVSAHYFAISRPWMRIMPSGIGAEAVQLRRHRHDVAGVIEVGQRQIAPQLLEQLAVDRTPLRQIRRAATLVEQPVHRGIAVVTGVVALPAVQELIGVAVDIDAPRPADQIELDSRPVPTPATTRRIRSPGSAARIRPPPPSTGSLRPPASVRAGSASSARP